MKIASLDDDVNLALSVQAEFCDDGLNIMLSTRLVGKFRLHTTLYVSSVRHVMRAACCVLGGWFLRPDNKQISPVRD